MRWSSIPRALRASVCAVLLSCTVPCATGCISQPAVTLKTATLRGPSLTGVAFDAMLAVKNDNAFDIQVRAVRGNVMVEGVRGVVPVNVEPNIWLPAGRTTLVAAPVLIPWGMLPGVAGATVFGPDLKYTVKGFADVTGTRAFEIERDDYAFELQGKLPRAFVFQAGPGGLSIGMGQ
jgi:hypothetical protein